MRNDMLDPLGFPVRCEYTQNLVSISNDSAMHCLYRASNFAYIRISMLTAVFYVIFLALWDRLMRYHKDTLVLRGSLICLEST